MRVLGIRGREVITEKARRLWALTHYEPHEVGWDYHNSEARFKFAACGRRFGKSLAAEKDWLPDLFDEAHPGRYWMIGLSYDSIDEFQYLWDDVVHHLKLANAPGMKMANTVRTGEMFIEFPWGTRVECKSIQNSKTLVGKGLKRVLLSEAAKMPPVIWHKYISPALADHRGKLDAPSSPEGFNWYYDEHLKGVEGKDSNYASWNFPSWENRVLFPLGFDDPEIQRQLPKDENGKPIDDPWFWQEIGAQFRTMAGMIFPEFNRKVHVKRLTYNPAVDNYVGMDYGYNGFVALDAMVPPSQEVHFWREYVGRERPVHEHAETLAIRQNPAGYKVRCAYGDAADPDAIATIGKKLYRCVGMPESKEVRPGLRLVKSFLRSPEGPKLFLDPSMVNTIRGFESYRRKTPRGLISNQETEFSDEPLKKDDHEMDAIRYLLMHLFRLGGLDSLQDLAGFDLGQAGEGIFTRPESDRIRMTGRTM